jgi:hypothetical protein
MQYEEIEFIYEYPDKWIVRLVTSHEGKTTAAGVTTPYKNRWARRIATVHTTVDDRALALKYFGVNHEEVSTTIYRLMAMPEEERKAWLGGVVACNS